MFIYHFVPENMVGSFLLPLNELEQSHPELFETHRAKYAGLKEQDVEIPGFGFWNDCINLMPVNPGKVKLELEKFGHDTSWPWKFYEINVESLDASGLIFMVPTDKDDASQRSFVPFSHTKLEKYSQFPEIARHRYKLSKQNNVQPYTFGGIPHVLYKGIVDVRSAKIVIFD